MSIFNNVNKDRLDSLIAQVRSCHYQDQPELQETAEIIFSIDDTSLKASAFAVVLTQWQNNLNEHKKDPASKILFNDSPYNQFAQSQRALNKFKRKFSRLVIENMPLA